MEVDELLERLRDRDPEGALSRLADLAVSDWLDQELSQWLEPRATAQRLHVLLSAWLRSEGAEAKFRELVEDVADTLEESNVRLGAWLGSDACLLLEALARRPHTPSRGLVLGILDRPPIRQLLRKLLIDALVGFGNKLRAPVVENRLTRGLGDLGRFARTQAMNRSGAFSAVAGVVGAVSEEVERQVERRAAESADSILSDTLQKLAGLLCDPDLGDEQAELRLALLEGILELSTGDVARELRRMDVEGASDIVRERILGWLEREESLEALASSIEWFLGRDAEKTVGSVLEELDLAEPVIAMVKESTLARMRSLVEGEGFGRWLGELLAGRT